MSITPRTALNTVSVGMSVGLQSRPRSRSCCTARRWTTSVMPHSGPSATKASQSIIPLPASPPDLRLRQLAQRHLPVGILRPRLRRHADTPARRPRRPGQTNDDPRGRHRGGLCLDRHSPDPQLRLSQNYRWTLGLYVDRPPPWLQFSRGPSGPDDESGSKLLLFYPVLRLLVNIMYEPQHHSTTFQRSASTKTTHHTLGYPTDGELSRIQPGEVNLQAI